MRKKVASTDEPKESALRISAKEKALILKAVNDKHGELTPDLVVKESNPKNRQGVAHRLADLVGWGDDDISAAKKWRIECARTVIRAVEPLLIDLGVIQIKAPFYVHDPMKGPAKQGYASLLSIRTEEEAVGDLMQAEISAAVSALERARKIAIALNLEQERGRYQRSSGSSGENRRELRASGRTEGTEECVRGKHLSRRTRSRRLESRFVVAGLGSE